MYYCMNCKCIEDGCHCSNPDMKKIKAPLFTWSQQCLLCAYKSRCHTLKRMDRMELDKKSEYFCAFCGCLKEVCHCTTPTDYKYYHGSSRR